MKSLYYISIADKTTNSRITVDVRSMSNICVQKVASGIAEDFDLDFTNQNPGLVEDIVKSCEWIASKYASNPTEKADTDIQVEIMTDNVDLTDEDNLWEVLDGVYNICKGEYTIQKGSTILYNGYDMLQKHVDVG